MLYIVEPHGDDALISCFTLMKSLDDFGTDSRLITLSERSSDGIMKYLHTVKTEFKCLEDINYKYKPKVNTHSINKMYKDGISVAPYVRSLCMSNVPIHVIVQSKSQLILPPVIVANKSDVVAIPLGLDHPYHILVSTVVDSLLRLDNKIYYIEKPYLSKRYIRQVVNDYDRIFEGKYDHIVIEYTDELKTMKASIFKDVYPTEQNLLRFTRDSILSDPDEFFVPHNLLGSFIGLFESSGLSYKVIKGGTNNESNDSNQS